MTYSDARNNANKRAKASLLISLGLHAVMAVIFTFILLEHPREEAAEFMAVDMVQIARRTPPPRRTHMRESIMDFQKPSDPLDTGKTGGDSVSDGEFWREGHFF